jgi:hypothetical protein
MPHWAQFLLLPACVAFFLAVMAMRIRILPKDTRRRTLNERLKFARVLVLALAGLLVVFYNLQKTNHSLDGKGEYEPGLLERIVRSIAG